MAEQTNGESHEGVEVVSTPEPNLKDRKVSWGKLRRVDSLHLEAGRVSTFGSHAAQVCDYNIVS